MRLFRQAPLLLCGAALCFSGALLAQNPQNGFYRYHNPGPNPTAAPTSYGIETVTVNNSPVLASTVGHLTVGSFDDNGRSSAIVHLNQYFQFVPVWQRKITLTNSGQPAFDVYGTAVCAVNQDYYAAVAAGIGGALRKYVVGLDISGNQLWTTYLGEGYIDKMKYNPATNQIIVLGEQAGLGYTAALDRNTGAVIWADIHDTFHSAGVFGKFVPSDMEIDIATGEIAIVGTVTHPTTQDKNVSVGRLASNGQVLWMNQYGYPNLDEEGKGIAIGTNSTGTGPFSYRVVANRGDDNVMVLEIDQNNFGALLSAAEFSNAPNVTMRVEDVAFNFANMPQGTPAQGVYMMTGTVFGVAGIPDEGAMVMGFNEGYIPITGLYSYNAGSTGETNDRFFDVKSVGNEWFFTGTLTPNVSGFNPAVFMVRTDYFGDEPALFPCRYDESVDVQLIQVPYSDHFEDGPIAQYITLNFPTHPIDWVRNSDCDLHLFKQGGGEEALEAALNDFTVFPNPAQDQVTLDFNQPAMGQLRLLDMQGRVQMTQPLMGQISQQLDLSAVATGMYLLEWQVGNTFHRKKLVVE